MSSSMDSCQERVLLMPYCFESVDGKVQGRTERTALFLWTWKKLMTRFQEKSCGIAC